MKEDQYRVFKEYAGHRVRFFMAPVDYYCLNSLELVDHEMLLYRILKEDGFERVIFLQVIGEENVFFAYDKISEYSFINPVDFEKSSHDIPAFLASVDSKKNRGLNINTGSRDVPAGSALSGLNIGRVTSTPFSSQEDKNGTKAEPDKIKKRRIISEVDSNILNYIRPALLSKTKTAIVVDWKALTLPDQKSQKIIVELSRTLEEISNRAGISRNLLIINIKDPDISFDPFIRGPLKEIVSQIETYTHEKLYPTDTPPNPYIVNRLRQDGLLMGVEGIGLDEIANLVRRIKYIEKEENFEKLKASKVYALSADILKTLNHTSKTSHSVYQHFNIKSNIRKANYICMLKNDLVVNSEAIVNYGNSLDTVKSRTVENVLSTDLECINHRPYEYIVVDKEKELKTALSRLNEMIGLSSVKTKINSLIVQQKGTTDGKKEPGHYAFLGNPGTGKTEVARLMGRILHRMGVLSKGHFVEVRRSKLISEHVGGTAVLVEKACLEAKGGVLFIDEAYSLYQGESDTFGKEAVDTLIPLMENMRDNLTVILAGYPDDMNKLFDANSGFMSRISPNHLINFDDYSVDELIDIMKLMAKNDHLILSDEFIEKAKTKFAEETRSRIKGFGNGRFVRNFLNEADAKRAARVVPMLDKGEISQDDDVFCTIIADDVMNENDKKQIDYWGELDKLVGLSSVKKQIRTLANKLKYSTAEVPVPGHYAFVGNPGTGKTEVAKLMGGILHEIGLLSRGHYVSASRAEIVGQHIGETAKLVKKKCEEARGGVLFIDEAYSLFSGGTDTRDFGAEAITTLIECMENDRTSFSVVMAGYEGKMKEMIDSNPGFNSRVTFIRFPNYSASELLEILELMCKKKRLKPSEEFIEKAKKIFDFWVTRNKKDFANAREVRNLLEDADGNRANRLEELAESGVEIKPEEKGLLLAEDCPILQEMVNRNEKPKPLQDIATGYHLIARKEIESVQRKELVHPYEETELYECAKTSILFVKTDRGSGTAFLISPTGYALTCNHVVRNIGKISARIGENDENGKYYDCEVVNVDEVHDMALLKLIGEPGEIFPYLNLASEKREVKVLENFLLPGYPFGRNEDINVFTNKISSVHQKDESKNISRMFMQGEAKSGNSGSPCLSYKDGCVIGFLPGSIRQEYEEINYIYPIKYFWECFTK